MIGSESFGPIEEPKKMTIGNILFSFDGRIMRQDWWVWSIVIGILGIIYGFIVGFFLMLFFWDIFYPPDEVVFYDGQILDVDPLHATTQILFLLPIWYIQIAITMKRLQDTGKGWGWGSLIILSYIFSGMSLYFPLGTRDETVLVWFSFIVGVPIWIICGFIEGTHGPNQFGPDPIQRQIMPSPYYHDNNSYAYNSAPYGKQPLNASELKELGQLRDSGILTEAEFQEQKDKILGGR